MQEIDIKGLVPRFIWNDRNGHAMAKALEAGMKYFLKVCQEGLDVWKNVDKMPEWRLDEMAWELNCMYDYGADVDRKRGWIRDAYMMNRQYGTPAAILKYLDGYFGGAELEEWWDYEGEPYHFRVYVSGTYKQESAAWTKEVINGVKNLRSVLDDLSILHVEKILVNGERRILKYPIPRAAKTNVLCGTLPNGLF